MNKIQYVIIIDERTSHRFYSEIPIDSTNCPICDYNLPLEDSLNTSTVFSIKSHNFDESPIVKCAPDDELNDQERFLKEREKKQFRKMMRKR